MHSTTAESKYKIIGTADRFLKFCFKVCKNKMGTVTMYIDVTDFSISNLLTFTSQTLHCSIIF